MDAMCMKDGGQVGVENAFAAQIKLAYPAQGLIQARTSGFNRNNSGVASKFFNPVERLGHRKRWRETARIGDHMKKFCYCQRSDNLLVALDNFGFGCARLPRGRCDQPLQAVRGCCNPNRSLASEHIIRYVGLRNIWSKNFMAFE